MHPRIFNAKSVGFTLIELLVVIAIVAIILAILLPALSKARAASRTAVCLSNHRQIGIAWQTYLNEFNNFPIGEDPDISTKYREDSNWGGVFWYDPTIWRPGDLASVRPMNPYLGHPLVEVRDAELFHCPLDNGAYDYFGRQTPVLASEGPHVTHSKSSVPRTEYGVIGNSYDGNEWMYCTPGERTGWGQAPARPQYRSNLGPRHVQISTSKFMLYADAGPINWMVSQPNVRVQLAGSWWHGPERCPMSFLDGSSRIEKAGLIVSPTYSLHMVPIYRPNLNFDFRWPGRQ